MEYTNKDFDMAQVIISLDIKDERGNFIPYENLDAQMLKRVRHKLMLEADIIKNRICKLTGEIID